MSNTLKIALVNDHELFRKGFSSFFQYAGYPLYLQCKSGKELIENIDKTNFPDLVFMAMEMPEMDGFETTAWLKSNYPSVKVLALSIGNDKAAIKQMIKRGALGYIKIYAEPEEIKTAIHKVIKKGHYFPRVDMQFQ